LIDAETEERVRELLRGFMRTWIARQHAELAQIIEQGVSPSGIFAPFHEALVPGIRGLGERGFSTALGNLHERIGLVIADHVHESAARAHDVTGDLPVLAREFITQRVAQLQAGQADPDHLFERTQLLAAFGAEVVQTVRIDLYVRTHSGEDHYFEIKSAKPNKGQCIEMKERLLTAFAMKRDPAVRIWWGVPYNPYGTAAAYAHPYPLRYFDFVDDVKLGADFWNFAGDDPGTYDLLLDLYREVGSEFTDALDELRAALAGRAV